MRKIGLIALIVMLGCGDDGSGDGSGGTGSGTDTSTGGTDATETTSSSATSMTGGSSGGSSGGTTTGSTDSGSATGSSGAGTGGTGAGTGSSGGGTGTSAGTSAGTTGGVGDVEYYAFALIGALDRVVVRKANNDTGQCTELRLVNPGPAGGNYAVTVPGQWGVEYATLTDSLSACLASEPLQGTPDWGTGGTGMVDWATLGPNQYYPCSIDVDVTVMFEQAQVWSKPSDTLAVQALAVNGCM